MRTGNSIHRLINILAALFCAAGILITVMWPGAYEEHAARRSVFHGHKLSFSSLGDAGTGRHFYFLHLHSNAAPGGDGSYEKPFADFAKALTAAQEARSSIIYIWGGNYQVDASRLGGLGSLRKGWDMVIAGAGYDLEIDGVTIPAQSRDKTLIRITGLGGQNTDDLQNPQNAFLYLEPTAQIALSGIVLDGGSGQGAAIHASPAPRESRGANGIRLDNCDISNFAAAIYCDARNRADITLLRGNAITNNSLYGVLTGTGRLRLGNDNKILLNGRNSDGAGLFSHYGNIEMDTHNDVSQNGYGIRAQHGDVIMSSGNTVADNSKSGILVNNGHVRLKNQNKVIHNGDNGIDAASDIGMGDSNIISDNGGCGLFTPGGGVTMQNSNSMTGNGNAGIYSGKDVLLKGNFNVVRRNSLKGDKNWHDVMTDGSVLMDGTSNYIPTLVGKSRVAPEGDDEKPAEGRSRSAG